MHQENCQVSKLINQLPVVALSSNAICNVNGQRDIQNPYCFLYVHFGYRSAHNCKFTKNTAENRSAYA